jgi:transcriptional regulator with XRE-family HTH domain
MIEQIRQAMRDSGRSLNKLSKESGVNVSRLSRFMRGERTLTLPAAADLCATLGLALFPVTRRRAK